MSKTGETQKLCSARPQVSFEPCQKEMTTLLGSEVSQGYAGKMAVIDHLAVVMRVTQGSYTYMQSTAG